MKLILLSFLGALGKFKRILKYSIWDFRLLKEHTIIVLEGEKYNFIHYGDITRVLYANQHFVVHKKGFEYTTLKIYKSLLKDNFTVLDIGANIGLFCILGANKIGRNGKIYAFEPIKKTFETLQQNLVINNISNVIPSRLALSNMAGKVTFSIPTDIENVEGGDAFNSMNIGTSNIMGADEVDCTMLDVFIAEHKIEQVDLIKIDIEGAEMLCFEGAKVLLGSSNPPIIIMECAESLCCRFNYTVFDVLDYLNQFGYTFEQYENGQWLALPKNSPKITSNELLRE